jgi:hypothetical protein
LVAVRIGNKGDQGWDKKDVDGFLTASSENDLFEGHEAQTNARTDRIGAPFLGPLMNIAAHIRFS